MIVNFSDYIRQINFPLQYKKIIKNLKNKKIVIYGAGSFFLYLIENYDFSPLNIIGISDTKFEKEDEGKYFKGFRIIPKDKILDYEPEVILLGVQNYYSLLFDFETNIFYDTNIQIIPIAKRIGINERKRNSQMLTQIFKIDWMKILSSKRKRIVLKRLLWESYRRSMYSRVKKDSKKVRKKLAQKVKNEKLKVVFTLHQAEKWKCETIYRLMEQEKIFDPYILITIPESVNPDYPSLKKNHFDETIKFFTTRNYKVLEGYDWQKKEYIPFNEFSPDIIFYQQPWNVERQQGPLETSKYALTCYVPYFIANAGNDIEYGLDFHLQLFKHYILNEKIKSFYAQKMLNNGDNLVVSGHPQLDYFWLNRKEIDSAEKRYVIYAPHWSINVPVENYATFEWSGRFMLEYAKSHPEIEWIFKPHPILRHRLLNQNVMTEKEAEEYWREWAKAGVVYESGDYMDFFKHARAMITDCGSFLTEFFLTKQPVIHMISDSAIPYNPSAADIVKNYYKAHNIDELERHLDTVIIQKNDYMKEQRIKALENMNLDNCYAAKNIIDDLKSELIQ